MTAQTDNLKGKRILLGVTGGIAAYKVADLASKLTAAGAVLKTIMTGSAQKLVAAKTFEAVTGQPVYTDMWCDPEDSRINHIQLADWADVVAVAPATANILAKMACGFCDDLLSATLCVCWEKPILLAPGMNTRMWNNPATQKNVEILKQRKIRLVGPAVGRLACGTEGLGRMAEPSEILAALQDLLK